MPYPRREQTGKNEIPSWLNLITNVVILVFTWEIVKLNRQNLINTYKNTYNTAQSTEYLKNINDKLSNIERK